MNELQVFTNKEFGEVRTVVIDNEPYFVGKDVAEILGYGNTKDALLAHVDEEDRKIIQRSENTTFEIPNRGLTIINESGLYSLILSSKLPQAKKFKRWVTAEILPTIRKTGTYSIPKLEKNPKYRTRMIGTAIRDVHKTAKEIASIFGVQPGMAMIKAISIIEGAYGINLDELKTLLQPARHQTGYLNATAIGEAVQKRAADVNKILLLRGLQIKINGNYRLTDKGREYGEEFPYLRNGHSGYHVLWNDKVFSVVS